MDIVICSGSYPSTGYAANVFVEQLVMSLVDRGNVVTVIAPLSVTHSFFRKTPMLPYKETRFTLKGNRYDVYRPKFLSFGRRPLLMKLSNWIKQRSVNVVLSQIRRPDVVYGHFWSSAQMLRKYAQDYNVPLFVACGEGDDALEEMVSNMTDVEISDLKNSVAGVVSVSTENKRKCLKFGLVSEDRVEVFPNCVDKKIFHPISKLECRDKLNIGADDFVIAFVGSFIPRKGSGRLAEAINRINDKRLKSIFIGRTQGGAVDCTPNCEGIVFCGPLDHELLPMYLNAADIFVLPTQKEGCCNAIVEAMSCGLPVVSSNLPFNDDILDDSCGIRVNSMDVGEIEAAIRKLQKDRALLCDLSRGALHKTEYSSIESRAEKIEQFMVRHK